MLGVRLPRPPRFVLLTFGGLTLLVVGFIVLVIGLRMLGHYVWGVDRLFRTAPDQPIAFPHPRHVDAGIDCVFCHRMVTTQPAASIPPVEQCAFCHQIIGKDRPEVEKVLTAFQEGKPINWVRVHRLPDHVRFVHEAHVNFFSNPQNYPKVQQEYKLRSGEALKSATCAICHGDVAKMEQVRQAQSLKMGNCVDCHRKWGAPTDCWACHF